jgi:hypothetical protein
MSYGGVVDLLYSVTQIAIFYVALGMVGYALLVVVHTPEALVKLVAAWAAPELSRTDVDTLVGYAYIATILVGLTGIVIYLSRTEARRHR